MSRCPSNSDYYPFAHHLLYTYAEGYQEVEAVVKTAHGDEPEMAHGRQKSLCYTGADSRTESLIPSHGSTDMTGCKERLGWGDGSGLRKGPTRRRSGRATR